MKAEKRARRQEQFRRINAWLHDFQRDWPYAFALFCTGIGCVVAAVILELLSLLPH